MSISEDSTKDVMKRTAGDAQTDMMPRHPLEPLSAEEITAALEVVSDHLKLGQELRIEIIELFEPPKQEVYSNTPDIDRQAFVNAYRANKNGVWRMIVSITRKSVISSTFLDDVYPRVQFEEYDPIEKALYADPRFVEALKKRGITDLDYVITEPWSTGRFGQPDEDDRFVVHTFSYVRNHDHDNHYAHPIEGVNAIVDVRSLEVVRVDDHGVVPIPRGEHNWEREFIEEFQEPLAPLDITQPEGVGFERRGNVLTYRDWHLVIGFNEREGLTLHDIRFQGRSVCYRASIAEMVVPYGSPVAPHYRKNIFDTGEYGLGMLANSLTLGCDCLGAIDYVDGLITDFHGNPKIIKNAICIHEEDSGMLWKHTDLRTGRVEVRRGRKLVISFIATLDNYEYAIYWYFHLDGMIECECKATGIVNAGVCIPGKPGKYAHEVAPGLKAKNHQHLFCARLDMAVDGINNTVFECDSLEEVAGENPHGNAFYVQETPVKVEGARDVEPYNHRFWTIENPGKQNAMGYNVAYKIVAKDYGRMMARPDSPNGKRMASFSKPIWVTAFDREERYPSGEYMHHSTGEDGLPRFVSQGRNTENTDVVLWHNFTLHHRVRAEDWPVQPVVSTGFAIMPENFCDQSPVLNLPPEKNEKSVHAHCCAAIE